jgi:hypothetical protein
MRYMTFTILGAAFAAALASGGVRADTKVDVEQARANALAGGPISAQDAELLRRYGCESGTRNAFCESLRHDNGGPYAYVHQRRRWPY